MKTIEKKAKAYDKALEKARRMYNSTYHPGRGYTNADLETLFPELKESDDEKIRKNIKIALMSVEEELADFYSTHHTSQQEFLNWLEKQGEESSWKPSKEQFEALDYAFYSLPGTERGMYYGDVLKTLIEDLHRLGNQGGKKTIITPKFSVGDEIKTGNEESLTITKIDEQGYWSDDLFICDFDDSVAWDLVGKKIDDKVEPKFKVGDIIKFKTKNGNSEPWQIIQVDMLDKKYRLKDGYVIHFSEEDAYELVEQKADDKFEPRFKVGDWVVFNNRHDSIYQVEKIENYEYTLRHILGDRMRLPLSNEDMIREWTIQDAKDGDVLVYRNSATEIIMLFKSWRLDKEVAYTHFHIFDNEYRVNSSCDCGYGVHPATKEQRDLLFQKMKEAGYEWNAEKMGLLAWGDKNPACSEENSAWNEKDDNNVKQLNEYLKDLFDDYRLGVQELNDYETWLKSLKQRIGG